MTDDQEEKFACLKVVAARCFARDDAGPAEVLQGLYVGSVGSAKNVNLLVELGVTHVLNASPVVPCFHKKRLKYKVLEVYDDVEEDISQFFEESNQFIDEALRKNKGVLVHCYAGQSRSPTLVVAYLMARRRMSFLDALQRVRGVRPATRPNQGFILQLKAYAETLATQFVSHSLTLPRSSLGDASASDTDDDCGTPTHEVLDGVLPEDRLGTVDISSDCHTDLLGGAVIDIT